MTNMEGSLVFMRTFVADKKFWSQKAEARKDMVKRRNIAWFSQSRNLLFQKDKEEEWNYCYDQHALQIHAKTFSSDHRIQEITLEQEFEF